MQPGFQRGHLGGRLVLALLPSRLDDNLLAFCCQVGLERYMGKLESAIYG